jgi:hypothetical protein
MLLSGCAHNIPLKGTLESPPSVTQVPLAVGVYYSPEFCAHKHEDSRKGDRWIFPLGEASVTLFDQVLPRLFKSVLPVQTRHPLATSAPALAVVIEPKIEVFDFAIPFLKTGTYSAELTYRFTLYSPQGNPFASWLVKGEAAKPGEMGFSFAR